MSASVPGPKARSHAATSAAVPSASDARLERRAEPRRHRRPARSRRGPRAGVGGPDDGAGRGQHGQHVRPDRHLAGPCLAFAVRDHTVEEGHLVAQLGERHRAAIRERGDHLAGHLLQPARAVAMEAESLDEARQAAALQRGHAVARARLRIGQPLAREDEQRPPHRQVLHQRPIDVQRALEVGHRHAGDAGLRGQEDRRRIGGVQADHAACRLDDVGGAVRGGQAVPDGEPGSTLGDGEATRDAHAARS